MQCRCPHISIGFEIVWTVRNPFVVSGEYFIGRRCERSVPASGTMRWLMDEIFLKNKIHDATRAYYYYCYYYNKHSHACVVVMIVTALYLYNIITCYNILYCCRILRTNNKASRKHTHMHSII